MKQFMNFKRGAVLLSAIAMAVSVSAQTENYVPKHEFSISGFGGMSSLQYKVDFPETSGMDYKHKIGFGGGIGFDWTYHFDQHWGIRLGIQGALYQGKAEADLSITPRENPALWNTTINKIDGTFSENQRAVYAQVPLMVQWMTPVGKHNFYAALGGKFGYRLWDGYKQVTETRIQRVVNAPASRLVAIYDFPEGKVIDRGSVDLKRINAMASAEVGMRWTLDNGIGLYTGLYFDYGFLNIRPDVDENGYSENGSILAAFIPENGLILNRKATADYVEVEKTRAVDRVNTMAGGLVLRLSFGKGAVVVPACPPCPDLPPIEKIEKVVKHEKVEVVKEIPTEIKDKMKELSNALFAFDKFDINPKAAGILDEIASWLKKNPQMKCELSGHTDGKGSVAYNQKLSEQRAKAVYDYLIQRGVSADNLSWKGYGKSEPIATNDTAAGRQLNRRVELRLVK